MRALVLAGALGLAGCSLAPSDQVIKELVASERSWCLSLNTIYGTARMSGTGIDNGSVSCNQEGMVVNSEGATDGPDTRDLKRPKKPKAIR
jgi:hypothetical protein